MLAPRRSGQPCPGRTDLGDQATFDDASGAGSTQSGRT